MKFIEWYPWLNVIYSQILSAYKSDKGHHFLLIESKKNNGVDSLVYALSRWLMCISPIGDKSCNKCQGCYLMKAFSHPDYYSLEPEGDMISIGVDEIRILIEKLYQYAYCSNIKIVYIKNSEWLTEASVNALLKVFEEPPNGIYFFLGCKNYEHLLPTFLSRCLRWKLIPPVEKVSLEWLCKKGIKNRNESIAALRFCGGAPLEAYIILKSDFWNLRSKLCKEFKNSLDSNNFLSMWSLFIEDNNNSKVLVSCLCSFYIDALKWNYNNYDFLVNVDYMSLIRAISFKFSSLILSNQLQQWLICLRYWENIIYINQKTLLLYQLLNIEGNVLNFLP